MSEKREKREKVFTFLATVGFFLLCLAFFSATTNSILGCIGFAILLYVIIAA